METKKLQQYAQIEAQYREIAQQREALRKEIVQEMKDAETEKLETGFGTFTRATKRTFEYSDRLKKREENLKIAKKREEEKGIATPKATEYLVFKGDS